VAVGQVNSKMPQTGTYTQTVLLLGAKRSFRDHALQGLATVKGRNLSASALISTDAAVSAADVLVDRGDRRTAEARR